jgi:hypothetical protein
MTAKKGSAKRRIITTKENGEIYKIFDTVDQCAEYFRRTKAVIFNHCAKSKLFYRENGIMLSFQSERREAKEVKESDRSDVIERKLRATETEDQTRRRLGLNPYGEWRNDEWLFAMFDRVNKKLYPDGYDEHAAFLSWKGKQRGVKGQRRETEEERLEKEVEVDPEFRQYFK